jgi:hypothetical protein
VDTTYKDPRIAWHNELEPSALPSPEPPQLGPFMVTRSGIVLRGKAAPAVHIWYAYKPAVPAVADWLAEHGDDLIPVKLIDLLSAVGRIEQADREHKIEYDGSAAWRLVTCDLPRLRGYLPEEAIRELGS